MTQQNKNRTSKSATGENNCRRKYAHGAKVPQPVAQIPWGHHLLLMEKAQTMPENLKSSLPAIEQIEAELQSENQEAQR